jgi:hypothetical protein
MPALASGERVGSLVRRQFADDSGLFCFVALRTGLEEFIIAKIGRDALLLAAGFRLVAGDAWFGAVADSGDDCGGPGGVGRRGRWGVTSVFAIACGGFGLGKVLA